MLTGKQVGVTREFLGVPYAKPPVGALRFAPPQPVDPWSGTRDATAFGPACPQISNMLTASGPQSEDCLTLDVYTPLQVSKALPVMVFIHGGAFVTGASSQYDGKILSEASLVVVTINYRLGALGFFSHPALDATRAGAPSGSDGIRDQQLALQWVHDNIAAFGGDPNNVTVFGESAGAISACVHLASPGSKGLAQRFIMESGSCTSDGYAPRKKADADALGQQMAAALCAGQSDVPACLRGQPLDAIVNWGNDMGLFGPPWSPTVEGAGGVLPDTFEQLIAKADALPPIIVGTNKNEWGLYQLLGSPKEMTEAAFKSAVEAEFSKASLVESQYAVQNDAGANDVYVQLISDLTYHCPARTLARLVSAKQATVYAYSFEQGAAYHSQELDYVFGGSALSSLGGGPPAPALASAVQRYWSRFAMSGDPNGAGDPSWPKYQTASDAFLVLVDPPHTSSGVDKDNCDFWASYFRNGGSVTLQ